MSESFVRTAEVLRAIRPYCNAETLDFVEIALAEACAPIKVERLAARLGIHRRALEHRLAGEDLPTPTQIIAWCRLVRAAHCFESNPMTVEAVAAACGYSSDGALRKAANRFGVSMRSLRAPGGFARAVLSFGEALRRSRQDARQKPRVR